MNKTEIFGDVVLIAQKFFYKSVRFFYKNDEKTTLKLYMISQQIYLKKNELRARVRGTLRDLSLY